MHGIGWHQPCSMCGRTVVTAPVARAWQPAESYPNTDAKLDEILRELRRLADLLERKH
jgi:hypothetical protein